MENSSTSSEVALYNAAKGSQERVRGSSGEKEAIAMLVEQVKELIENGGMFWAASSFLYSYIAKGQGGSELRRNATIGMGAIALFKAWRMMHAQMFTTVVIPHDLADQSDLYRYARELLQHTGDEDSGLNLAQNSGAGVPMKMVPSHAFQSTSFDLKPWRKTCPLSGLPWIAQALLFFSKSHLYFAAAWPSTHSIDVGGILPQRWAAVDRSEKIRVSSSKSSIKRGEYLRVGAEIMQVWNVASTSSHEQTLSVFRALHGTSASGHAQHTAVSCLTKPSWVEATVKRFLGAFGPGKLLWISEDTSSVPGGADKKDAGGRVKGHHGKQGYPNDWSMYYGYGPGSGGKMQPQTEQGLVLTVLGRDLGWLSEMLAEGKQVYDRNAEGHLVTVYRPESVSKKGDPYSYDYGVYGHGPAPDTWVDKRVPGRPLASVVLPRVQGRGQEEALRDDVARFFSPEEERFYRARGMPHRRGFLLHGVPGSGKTSVIKAIACDLGLPIFQMSLSLEGMTDSVFMKLMDKVPARAIILFEDIDAAKTSADRAAQSEGGGSESVEKPKKGKAQDPEEWAAAELGGLGRHRARREPHGQPGVQLDTLLNALDGLNAQENRVVFMTTNHKERLDAALVRPGRIDKEVEFGYVSAEQAERYFVRFYTHLTATAADAEVALEGARKGEAEAGLQEAAALFGRHVEGLSHFGVPIGLSVCELQQFLMEHRGSFSAAAAASAVQLRQTLLAKYFKMRFKPGREKQEAVVRSTEHNAAVFARSVAPRSADDMREAVRFLDAHKTQAAALQCLADLLHATPSLRPNITAMPASGAVAVSG